MHRTILLCASLVFVPAWWSVLFASREEKPAAQAATPETLPGTMPLTMQGDIASTLVEGCDRFLLREIERAASRRDRHWKRDTSSWQAYAASVEPNRRRLAHILGVRDPRVPFAEPERVGGVSPPLYLARGEGYEVFAVRWPAFGDVHGEGLLLIPAGASRADVVAIPDADQLPEQLVGLMPGVPEDQQFARRLVQCRFRVLVPSLINRNMEKRGRAVMTHREFLYRPAYELGRGLLGYEVQKVLAGVDWFVRDAGEKDRRIGVVGWGEGGLIALYAAALDTRIGAACVSGCFDRRERLWEQPMDRNVFGLLDQFGDAEIAGLIAPRALIVEAAKGPEVKLPGQGGAPGVLATPKLADVQFEFARAKKRSEGLQPAARLTLVTSGSEGTGPPLTDAALGPFHEALTGEPLPKAARNLPRLSENAKLDPAARHARQLRELDRHNQQLLAESPYVRREFMNKLDFTSPESYAKSAEAYREYFATEVIGRFDHKPLPPNPRSRRIIRHASYTGYEVVLDVFPDVIAYGILLVPTGVKPGERRPVVVCQHGLEGRPQDVVQGNHPAYHDFAAKLAERGFVTFAPQNLYLFRDRFRTLQRKANPIQKTLFSLIVPQHQQIVDWLKTQPFVDDKRIAFYGLSYGGKTAMRVPPLVPDYCLSICSADFNDWVWKNASSRAPYSYVWTGEYEIFEFDLGSTFNYAEMAALIAPRPFMVERGHFDGVAPDEAVAYEFAKVRHLYNARLKLPADRCEIEWFVGPHTINGKGTFDFLHRHLAWPKPAAGGR